MLPYTILAVCTPYFKNMLTVVIGFCWRTGEPSKKGFETYPSPPAVVQAPMKG